MTMPALLQQLIERLRSGREVEVVVQTTRGTQTIRVPLRDLRS